MAYSKYNTALTIAGSDPSGGAGLQADLKTFQALGCYGMSVVTALTAQNTIGVQSIYNIPPEFIFEQLKSVFSDIEVNATKLGMLSNAETIYVVARALKEFRASNVVLDPVMVSKSGHALLEQDAIGALREELIPLAKIITPNIPEAEKLLGRKISSKADMEAAATELLTFGCEAVILKGGHLDSSESPDVYIDRNLEAIWFPTERIDTSNTHGTGCTFASAIAAQLAKGLNLRESVRHAKQYLTLAIERGLNLKLGSGQGPVCHF